MNDDTGRCPICTDPSTCRGYPHLWRRLREDPEKWLPVHERLNATAPASYPPLATQAMTAARAAIGFAASGFKVVGDEERARRLAVCEACEHFDAGPGRCRKCSCVAAWKARIAREHCPVGRW